MARDVVVNNVVYGVNCCNHDANKEATNDKHSVSFDITPNKPTSLLGRTHRGIAKFYQENSTMEMTFGPYGWCIRPDISSPLDNGPFSTVYFSCSVLKMLKMSSMD